MTRLYLESLKSPDRVVLDWARSCRRGDRVRLAHRSGLTPQSVSHAIRAAQSGRITQTVRRVAAVIAGTPRGPVADFLVPSFYPNRLDDVVRELSLQLLLSESDVDREVRQQCPVVRNFIDGNEYVFAVVKIPESPDDETPELG